MFYTRRWVYCGDDTVAHALILVAQEADIRRITAQKLPRKVVCEALS
jgi:hypothetical protein